jgi:protoporphyrin/coproporphyrin ferrochelatase
MTSRAANTAPARSATEPAPTGVLMVNLGTPASPAPRDVRRFLREFLWDERVVDLNRAVWWLVLNGVVLPLRGRSSARLYRSVWTADGSPILCHSRRQRDQLARRLGPGFCVALGMRYGAPGLAQALDELCAAGCARVVVLPMFPQYSETTTGSVLAAVDALVARGAYRPELHAVRSFHADRGYVRALAARVREAAAGRAIDHHVLSFHGIPVAYAERGDPYPEQCRATAEALAAELDLAPGRWTQSFQSRFGPQAWLEPYTDVLVTGLAGRARRVLVAMPGFACDCLETLEEIGIRLREAFVAAGGEELVVVPALNDHPAFVAALEDLVRAAARSPAPA